jgi:hypothetical protein
MAKFKRYKAPPSKVIAMRVERDTYKQLRSLAVMNKRTLSAQASELLKRALIDVNAKAP